MRVSYPKNSITKKYRLGMKLLELGNIVKAQIEIRDLALPVIQELALKTEESIDLNILVDDKRVNVEKIESPQGVCRIIQLGKSLPLYCGGSGKAILAFQSDSEIERIIGKENIISFSPNTITDNTLLREHLKKVRKKGYA